MWKVFLVDDEEIILKQIEQTVPWMDNGFEVIGMDTNPDKAVGRILELKPDVVISDLRMPKLDGHTLMRTVKEAGLDVEFVMLSAYGTFEDARTFFQQEGFDYLLKPLQIQEVQLVLEKLARKLAKKKPFEAAIEANEVDEVYGVNGVNGVNDASSVNPAFAELIQYVKSHFAEKFTLSTLSKKFGLSAGYICNLFAKCYNTTLTCFVTKVRMEHAVELMKDKSYSLKNVAIECGYMDYFYFNKVFRGYYGVAPSQYTGETYN
ncbi:MAG: response regulator [Lachnospiraceae bacterium]|nr:response regulator [Lachnospiraceae bacterium]